jgi:hypothetical protein
MDCRRCKLPIQEKRAALGYVTCRVCAEVAGPKPVRTVVPLHKSNYILVTSRDDLLGINNKGGMVR